MKYLNSILLQQDGITVPATVRERITGNIHAVYMQGQAEASLDPEMGGVICIAPEAVKSWMADYRHSEYWCRPAFGTDLAQIPDQTQGLIWQNQDGSFGVVLPVVSEQYKCTLIGTEVGIEARLYSWHEVLRNCNLT